MALSNWERNERQAAARLGFLTVNKQTEQEKVHTLDIELDDGSKVALTITRRGALVIQTYRACLKGKSLYALAGSAIVAPADVRDWSQTLQERLESTPPAFPVSPAEGASSPC